MKYLRYVFTTLIVVGLFGGYFYWLTITGQIEQNSISNMIVAVSRPYPALSDPREITLNCDYHGKNLSVSDTLYGSLDEYYKTDPAKKSAYLHNLEKNFVYSHPRDNTIKDLAGKISAVGAANGLNADQTLDLSACFMQSIPYDDAKATRILGPDFARQPIEQVIPRYPYETLYDKAGICTDKTYLGAAVLRELGYQTAIMTFDAQKHMSLGVAVPDGYGSLGTKYGIMELTGTGFLVGDVPELNPTAGLAINNFQTLPQADGTVSVESQQALTSPNEVIPVSEGLVYGRIVARTATKQELEALRPQLVAAQTAYTQARAALTAAEADLAAAETTYKARPSNSSYAAYTTVYNQYLYYYNNAQSKINQYNKLVNLYNSYVEKYRQF